MTADVIQFIPRANPKADRAFWKGVPEHAFVPPEWVEHELMQQDDFRRRYLHHIATAGSGKTVRPPTDTTSSEYVAPESDPA